MTKKVLVLCTGNSCRSQMAEALWNHFGQGTWQASSAGSNPAGYVHPMSIEVMKELGHDLSDAKSKHLDEFADERFDIVVTVCDNANENCPVYPQETTKLHWPFDDPAYAEGDDEAKRNEFRRVRDEIASKIESFLKSE